MINIKTSDFKEEVLEILNNLSQALDIEPAVILESIFIKRVARDHAAGAVYGEMKHLMTEFAKDKKTGQVRRGQELYNAMYREAVREFEQDELYRIENKLQYIGFDRLPENEQELMKRYKMDPESKDQKQKDNADIQALIDSGDLILDENQTQPKDKKSIYEP